MVARFDHMIGSNWLTTES